MYSGDQAITRGAGIAQWPPRRRGTDAAGPAGAGTTGGNDGGKFDVGLISRMAIKKLRKQIIKHKIVVL